MSVLPRQSFARLRQDLRIGEQPVPAPMALGGFLEQTINKEGSEIRQNVQVTCSREQMTPGSPHIINRNIHQVCVGIGSSSYLETAKQILQLRIWTNARLSRLAFRSIFFDCNKVR